MSMSDRRPDVRAPSGPPQPPSSPLRIALIGPVYPYRGGIAHYTTLLSRTLRERGNELLLVSFRRQYPRWLYSGTTDKDPSASPLLASDARYWIDSINPFTWLRTLWGLRRHRPQVVVLPWWTAFLAPAWLCLGVGSRWFLRTRVVFICHNVLPHEARRWDIWLVRVVLAPATRLIVQSPAERERLLKLLPGANVSVIAHPIYDMFASDSISQAEGRRRLGLPADVPVLLFFGFVRKYKGLDTALGMLPELRARLGHVILLVAGEFWEDKQVYLDLIEQLGVGDAVVIHDRYIPNEQVATYFCSADVLVAPYRRMTGSGVMQMAAGFGLPVVPGWVASGQHSSPEGAALAEEITAVIERQAVGPGVRLSATGWDNLAECIESEAA